MGLWMFLVNHDQWSYLHSNCSVKNASEWFYEGSPNVPIGILYMILGICAEIIYVPFMIAMMKREFIQYSCYKFMFMLGIIDMIVLPFNAIIGGYQCATGSHFCTNPSLYYIVGAIGTSGWYTASMICVVLAIDRFFEMTMPRLAKMLFTGKMMIFWLAMPLIYGFTTFFQVPALYSTKFWAFFFDPFAGTEGLGGMPQFYELTFHSIHNLGVAFFLAVIYAVLCIVLVIQSKFYNNVNVSKLQKLMTLQSLCICVEIFIAAVTYVYMQFFPVSKFVIVVAHICWILIHGDTPVVYLLLNDSLRKAVFLMVRHFTKKSYKTAVTFTRINNPSVGSNRINPITPIPSVQGSST